LPAVAFPGLAAGLAFRRDGVGAPQALASRRIVGIDKPADAELAACDAGDDFVAQRKRGRGDAVALQRILDLDLPEKGSGAGVERDQGAIQRAEEEPVTKHRNPAVDAVGLVRIGDFLTPVIAPELAAGPSIERHECT
jgi:hypothetical protein